MINQTPTTLTATDFEMINAIEELLECAFAVQSGRGDEDLKGTEFDSVDDYEDSDRDNLRDAMSSIHALSVPKHSPNLNARIRAIASDMVEFIDASIGD